MGLRSFFVFNNGDNFGEDEEEEEDSDNETVLRMI